MSAAFLRFNMSGIRVELLGRKGLRVPVLVTRVSCQAGYRLSAASPRPEDPGSKRAVRRRLRSDTSRLQHRPAASQEWQHRDWSLQGKELMGDGSLLKNQRSDKSRLSPELKKLCLDDFPEERRRKMTLKSAPRSKADNYEIVFGIAPCLFALTRRRRKVGKLFVKDGEASQRISVLKVCEEAHRRGVQIQQVSKKELDRMSSGGVHQGVCLQASPLSFVTEDSAPSRTRIGTPLWLILESIQDPMNLGAILRSAYFLGVDRVASSLAHSCPLSPVVSKASSGIMEVMGVYGYENLGDMLRLKAAQGWEVVGTVGQEAGQEAGQSQIPVRQCSDFHITKPTLLLMGSEGDGLSPELLTLCQTLLTIPPGRELVPGIESLNVSVATGILLHSLLSSRRSGR